MLADMGWVIAWWLIVQALGWTAWPLAFRALRWLPDRGYMLAKPLGLLLVQLCALAAGFAAHFAEHM